MVPGQEEFWQALGPLARRKGGFTGAEAASAAGITGAAAHRHLLRLEKGSFAARGGVTAEGEPIWQVRRHPMWPPVLEADGTPSKDHLLRANLWRAAKMVKTFTARELALVASTEEVPAPLAKARRFCELLSGAGYFAPLEGPGRTGEAEWMLKPAMNTGPLPPRICGVSLVYDLNRRCFFGHLAVATEVKL
jgi:hypothetical protein